MNFTLEVKNILEKDIKNKPVRLIASNKASKAGTYKKVDIRLITAKGKDAYQVASYTEKQVFQQNVSETALLDVVLKLFPTEFKQLNIFFADCEKSYKCSKNGKLLTNTNKKAKLIEQKPEAKEHNRKKNYILQEGMIIPPLVDMGIFTKDGKVVRSMYDKFKQINRFIELVDDVIAGENATEFNIIDFGCGKSYLTFIMYYYFVNVRHINVNIVGLDLKEDVIANCNETAKKYGYEGLTFKIGDIKEYTTNNKVDMVVTLHACDTATDYALANAIKWNARYILSVPCCQHELNGQIACDELAPMMDYGIIKERMAALATDAIRAKTLVWQGYKTQLIEFVDMAHSPKNILIRAVKSNISKEKKKEAHEQIKTMCEHLNVQPTICKLTEGI